MNIIEAQYENLNFKINREPSNNCCYVTLHNTISNNIQKIVIFNGIQCSDFSFINREVHVITDEIDSLNDIHIEALSVTIFGRLFAKNTIEISGIKDVVKKSSLLSAIKSNFFSKKICIFRTQNRVDYNKTRDLINSIVTIDQDANIARNIILLLNNTSPRGLSKSFIETPSLDRIPSHFRGIPEDFSFYSPPLLFSTQPTQKNFGPEHIQLNSSYSIRMSINTVNCNYIINCGQKRFYVIYDIKKFDPLVAKYSVVIFAKPISINTLTIIQNIKNVIFIESIRAERTISILQKNSKISHIGNFVSLSAKTIELGKTNIRFIENLTRLRTQIDNLSKNDSSIDWKKTFLNILEEIYIPYYTETNRYDSGTFLEKALDYFKINKITTFPQELPVSSQALSTSPQEPPALQEEPFSLFTNTSFHAGIFLNENRYNFCL